LDVSFGLGIAVRDILAQRDTALELIAVDDGSSDGSREFLVAVAHLLGERGEVEMGPVVKRAKLEEPGKEFRAVVVETAAVVVGEGQKEGPPSASSNPPSPRGKHPKLLKLEAKRKEKEGNEQPCGEEAAVAAAPAIASLSPAEVASAVVGSNRLRVVCASHGGQGAAMNLALSLSQAPWIGQMESDDERPEGCFATLLAALALHPDWGGVCSSSQLIGWDRGGGSGTQREREGGMQRYVEWQNSLQSPAEMAHARFIEIPALHQSCLYKRDLIEALGGYTSDHAGEKPGPRPVDMDFWLKWHEAGNLMGKVPTPLYRWRQHPSSDSRHREQGKCSLENLRKLKAHYLCRPGGPCHNRRVQVWSVGYTTKAYVLELEAAVTAAASGGGVTEVLGVEWNSKLGQGSPPLPEVGAHHGGGERWVRLFAYGAPAARRRVRHAFRADWDPKHDWLIA